MKAHGGAIQQLKEKGVMRASDPIADAITDIDLGPTDPAGTSEKSALGSEKAPNGEQEGGGEGGAEGGEGEGDGAAKEEGDEADADAPPAPAVELDENGEPIPPPIVKPTDTLGQKPWFAIADISRPEDVPLAPRTDTPQDNLDLLWIHGYSSHLRQNVQYDNAGKVFTTAGCNLLVLSKGEEGGWNQKILSEHTNPISCMALDRSGKILVTGDTLGPPTSSKSDLIQVVLWNTADNTVHKKIVMSDSCPGIRYLDVSPSGRLLLTVFADDAYTVAVYDITTSAAIFSRPLLSLEEAKSGNIVIYDAKFSGVDEIFAIAGSKGVIFYVNENTAYVGASNGHVVYEERVGLYQKIGAQHAGEEATCLCRFAGPDEMVSGTSSGKILLWSGRNCTQVMDGHIGPVVSLYYCNSTGSSNDNSQPQPSIASCGTDGVINVFRLCAPTLSLDATKKGPKVLSSRTIERALTMSTIVNAGLSTHVRSLCLHTSGEKILIGTDKGDICELSCLAGPVGGGGDGEGAPAEGGEEGGAVAATSSMLGKDINGGPILQAHSTMSGKGVSGVCKAPNGYFSCGLDGTLRLWQCGEGLPHKLVKLVTMDSGCARIASSATCVAVALDGSMLPSRNGSVHVFSATDLTFIAEIPALPQNVSCNWLQVSPSDGTTIACGYADGNVVIYTFNAGTPPAEGETNGGPASYTLKGRIPITSNAESAASMRFDFSADGAFLRTLDGEENGKIIDLLTAFGAEVTTPDVVKAITWATNACPVSWDVKGVWASPGGVSVASLCNSGTDRSQHLFFFGNMEGDLCLNRLPAPYFNADFATVPARLRCHTGALASFCLIEDGSKVVTVGAEDGTVMIWKVNYDTEEWEPDVEKVAKPAGEGGDEAAEGGGEDDPLILLSAEEYDSGEDEDTIDGPRMFYHLTQKVVTDDKISAIQPWFSALGFKKSYFDKVSPPQPTPKDDLELVWAYGSNSRTVRSSAARYSHTGNIIFPAATMGVIFNKKEKIQQFAHPHSDAITCMDVFVGGSEGSIAASGHKGAGNINICVWECNTGKILKRISCGNVGAISAVSFCHQGTLLAAACQDANHTILVYDWRSGSLRATTTGGSKKVLSLSFSMTPAPALPRLLQGGITHFAVHSMPTPRALISKRGLFGNAGAPKPNVLCSAALPLPSGPEGGNEWILGLSDGSLTVIARGDRTVGAMTAAHKGGVTSVCVTIQKLATAEEPPQFKIVSAGVGGTVKVWDQEMQVVGDFSLYAASSPQAPPDPLIPTGLQRGIKSVCVDKSGRKILYATSGGEIGEMYLDSGLPVDSNGPFVMQSHYKNELNGLCAHPLRQEILTVGDDKTLRVFNLEKHLQTAILTLPDIARAVAISPNGQMVAVGLGGTLWQGGRRPLQGTAVFASYLQGNLALIHKSSDATDAITFVAFNNDGSKVYFGSADCNIYVYDAFNNFSLAATYKVHSQPIKSMDISVDGRHMLSVGIFGEVLLWDLSLGISLPESAREELLQEIVWMNRSVVCGRESVGVFAPYSRFMDVQAIAHASKAKLIATGDVHGALRLYQSPSPYAATSSSPAKVYAGHTPGGIARVIFSANDKYLVSIGRDDRTILQWKVVKSDAPPPATKAGNFLTSVNAASSDDDGSVTALPPENGTFFSTFSVKGVELFVHQIPAVERTFSAQGPSIVGVGNTPSLSLPTSVLAMSTFQYCGDGSIITRAGKVAYMLSNDRSTQTLLQGLPSNHNVSCISLSEDGKLALVGTSDASAGMGSLTLYRLSIGGTSPILLLSDKILGGVAACSLKGHSIACIGNDDSHTLYLWDSFPGDSFMSYAALTLSNPTGLHNSSFLSFISAPSTAELGTTPSLVTAGEAAESLTFWSVKGRHITGVTGNWSWKKEEGKEGDDASASNVNANVKVLAVVGIPLPSGQSLVSEGWVNGTGALSIWNGADRSSSGVIELPAPADALSLMTNKGIVSGGRDGVRIWTFVTGNNNNNNDVTVSHLSLTSMISMASILTSVGRPIPNALGDGISCGGTITSVSMDAWGNRLLIGTAGGLCVEATVDSGAGHIVAEGVTAPILGIASHPTEANTVATIQSDKTVCVWDISSSRRSPVAMLQLPFVSSSLAFASNGDLLVSMLNTDIKGKANAIVRLSLSDAPVKTPADSQENRSKLTRSLTIIGRNHNVGSGPIVCLRVAPPLLDDSPPSLPANRVAACCSDGSIFLLDGSEADLPILGTIAVFPATGGAYPVYSCDFSTNGRYLRAFGKPFGSSYAIKSEYYDLAAPPKEEVDPKHPNLPPVLKTYFSVPLTTEEITSVVANKAVSWATTSSPACPEASGVMRGTNVAITEPDDVNVTWMDSQGDLVTVGYTDGSVRLFSLPATGFTNTPLLDLKALSGTSRLSVTMTAGGSHIAAVGKDGFIAVWNLSS